MRGLFLDMLNLVYCTSTVKTSGQAAKNRRTPSANASCLTTGMNGVGIRLNTILAADVSRERSHKQCIYLPVVSLQFKPLAKAAILLLKLAYPYLTH